MRNDKTYHAIELLDATPSLFNSRHGDESEATRAVGLITTREHVKAVRGSEVTAHPLVVHNDDLFNAPEPTELVVEVPLGRPDAQTKYSQHVGRIGRLLRLVSPNTVIQNKTTNNGRMRGAARWRRPTVAGRPHRTSRARSAPRRRQVTVPRVRGRSCRRGRGVVAVGLVVGVGGGSGVGVLHRKGSERLIGCDRGVKGEGLRVWGGRVQQQRGRGGRRGAQRGLTMAVVFGRRLRLFGAGPVLVSESATGVKPYVLVMYSSQPPLATAPRLFV